MQKENGAVLLVSLIMLAILMVFGTSTLKTSMVDLKVAGNTQQSMDSLQKADAGVNATISLIGQAGNDPFENGNDNPNPFSGLDDAVDPLQVIENEVAVFTTLVTPKTECPRTFNASGSSVINCEFYQINSTHTAPNNVGISKTVIQGIRRKIPGA